MSNELNPEEKKVLESLVSPDIEKEVRYNFDETFQRMIVGMLLTDQSFLIETEALVKPSYFSSEIHREIVKVCYSYFKKYNSTPSKFYVQNEIKELKQKDKTIQNYWVAEIDNIIDGYVPELKATDREPLIDKVLNFAKTQSFRIAMHKAAKDITNNNGKDPDIWSRVYEDIQKSFAVERNFSKGLEVTANLEDVFRAIEEKSEAAELFTSSFPTIDNALKYKGMLRGELYVWMGFPGTGKSLLLCQTAVRNVLNGKKVLYLSLEQSEADISARFLGQFVRVSVKNVLQYKEKIREHIAEHIKDLNEKSLFVVKRFAGGTIGIPEIRAYLNQLVLHGWSPDMVILDYIGELQSQSGITTHELRAEQTRDFRGMAVQYNFCAVSAAQPNRTGSDNKTKDYLTDKNIGDSFGMIRSMDGFWTINQIDSERAANVARGYIAKHREGQSRISFCMAFDPVTYELTEIDQTTYNTAANSVMQLDADSSPVQVDGKSKKKPKSSKYQSDFDD